VSALQLIIFDCDGVLVDSERICNRVLADLLVEHGASITFAETVDMFIGKSLPQTLSVAGMLLGERMPSDFRAKLAERTRSALESQLCAVSGVREVLAALKLPYCVASNGNRAKMTLTLSLTGLLRLFEGRMFSSDDVAQPKPAPDLFLRAALSLGARPENCLVIEDTPTGVMAGKAAGMQVYGFVGLTPIAKLAAAKPTGIIHSMLEVLTLPGVPSSAA
jgi:HAD superfamily hydrolase (TIGR01509 family)